MGYMTTITILNDGFDQIEKYPQKFVESINEGMNGYRRFLGSVEHGCVNSFGIGNHCNNVMVARAHHADDPRMYVVFQNCLDIVGWGNDSTNLKHRKRVLEIAKQMVRREEEEIKKLEKEATK